MLERISPAVLLVLATLFWAGNFTLGRAVHAEIPPLGLAFWRWFLAGLLLIPFAALAVWRLRAVVRQHWRLLVVLAVLGVTGFNSLVYLGLQTTTASNGVLLQSVTPVFTIFLASLLLQERHTNWQYVGIVVSLLGVAVIVTQADIQVLLDWQFTQGDIWMLIASLDWALYTILLRKLPASLTGLPLLAFTVWFGGLLLLPLYWYESTYIQAMPFTMLSAVTVGYTAIFPSLLSFLFWNHATLRIGAGRTGQFSYLMPVFGILLAISLLGERLQWFHLPGVLLVIVGLVLSNWRFKMQ